MKKQNWLVVLLSSVFAVAASAQPSLQTLITTGLDEPYGVAVDSNNVHYLTDSAHHRIAKYDPSSGVLTNFAGVFGESGSNDGLSVFARFFSPQGIVVARGGLVVSDSGNHGIRLIADGSVSTLAGGTLGNQDGAGIAARFNAPAGLAADVAGNIYVADSLNSRIRRIDPANNVTTMPGTYFRPHGVSVDTVTGRIFVADTGNNCIKVIETDGTVTVLAGSAIRTSGYQDHLIATSALFSAPRAVLWVGGKIGLLVSDTGNGRIRRVYFNELLNTFSVETYLGTTLNAPVGLAQDSIGNFPVAELGGDRLSSVQVTAPQAPVLDPQIGVVILTTNFFGQYVTELVPVVNSTFNNDVNVAILAERGTDTFYTLDPDANFPEDPTSRSTPQPYENGLFVWPFTMVDPAVDGSNVVVRAIGTQDGRRSSQIVTARFQFKVANPIINGKNPGGFTMDIATEDAQLWYTTDGSSPADAAPSRLYVPGARLNIVNGTNDVVFKARAFKQGYTSSAEVTKTFLYADLQNSSIGVTRDYNAGIGSTIIVPVDVKLAADDVLQSLQFRVDITPDNGAPQISTEMRYIHITTNDFVQLPIVSNDEPLVSSFTTNNTTGLAISFIANTNLFPVLDYGNPFLDDRATVALVAVPIPATASGGQSYTIGVRFPSGTFDGRQTPVGLTAFADRKIFVMDGAGAGGAGSMSYLVGDSAVADGYNIGEFGDGDLNNNDVNNAFLASLGIYIPHPFTDLFDAMDAFPEDSVFSVGGDGQIRFLDWMVISERSLRLSGNNWFRSWAAGGVRVATSGSLNGSPSLPAEELIYSGLAWHADGSVKARTIEHAQAGTSVSVPVYIKLDEERSVSGLQFRAIVTPDGGAPDLEQRIRFVANGALPSPMSIQSFENQLPLNETVGAWSLTQNAFVQPLQGEALLGNVVFTVPSTATAGNSYTVRFSNVDGAPDMRTAYAFESLPGAVWVAGEAQRPAEVISDEWKLRFFGRVDHELATPGADADGDGVTNLDEYRQGNAPTQLRLHTPDTAWRDMAASRDVKLRWFGEQGKEYLLERSNDLNNWTQIADHVPGHGTVEERTDLDSTGATVFYRVRLQP